MERMGHLDSWERVAMPIDVEIINPPPGVSFRLLRWGDNLRDVEELTLDGTWAAYMGAGEHWHLHREMELAYIARGTGVRLVGDHIAPFAGPELELLGSNLPHCIQGLHNSKGTSVQFHWPPDHPLRALPEFAALEPLWERARRGAVFPPAVSARFGRRLLAMPRLPAASRLGALLQILAELAALPAAQSTSLSRLTFSVQVGERHQAGIERVIREVLQNYATVITLADALRMAGMSRASFERQFPRYAGGTFTKFLNRVRLDHARRLVQSNSKPISEIAYQTGFSHLSYFNRIYRRTYGRSPSAERTQSVPMKSPARSAASRLAHEYVRERDASRGYSRTDQVDAAR